MPVASVTARFSSSSFSLTPAISSLRPLTSSSSARAVPSAPSSSSMAVSSSAARASSAGSAFTSPSSRAMRVSCAAMSSFRRLTGARSARHTSSYSSTRRRGLKTSFRRLGVSRKAAVRSPCGTPTASRNRADRSPLRSTLVNSRSHPIVSALPSASF